MASAERPANSKSKVPPDWPPNRAPAMAPVPVSVAELLTVTALVIEPLTANVPAVIVVPPL